MGYVVLDLDEKDIITMEIHEAGQSSHNSEFIFESIDTYRRGQAVQVVMRASRYFLVDTPTTPCFDTNDHSITRCVYDYIEESLGCNLPWLRGKSIPWTIFSPIHFFSKY